jgi:hypothetical protein
MVNAQYVGIGGARGRPGEDEMRHRYPILATMLVLATLLAGRAVGKPTADDAWPASSPSADGQGMAATPTPQLLIGQPPDWEPLPEGCTPERVVGIVQELVDAVNRGDQARLAALFRPDILDADGTPTVYDQPQLGWFGVVVGSDAGVFARSGEELAAWAAARHAHGERWTVLQLFMGGYWWKGGVNISYDVRREADDLAAAVVGGKGAVDCNHGTVFMWTLGGPPVLPEFLFEPGATPEGVGLAFP